ncbi:MAG: autotransporter assembly complex family protein [Gammaproteobacteria bacterium]|nr:autotransporter assembly complex family protein [Gammaproteobacteria bacterium]
MTKRLKNPGLCSLLAALALLAAPPSTARVELSGLDREEQANVTALLELDDEPCDAPEWRIRQRFAESDRQIRAALEVYGYYSLQIESALEFGESCWDARFNITPGDPVRLRDITVMIDGPDGVPPEFQRLLQQSPLQAGEPLHHPTYETFRKRIADVASRFGYFESEYLTRRIDVFPREQAADITLEFRTGPRYRFGDIEFDQYVVRESLARRYLNFSPGDPYDGRTVGELYEDLLISGYFDRVDIVTTPRPAPDLDVPIKIVLTPSKARTYTAGVGFGTDTGVKFRAGFEHRRLNRKGHQFEADASYSDVVQEIGAAYRLPLRNPRDEWLNFDLAYRGEDTDTSVTDRVKFGIKRFKRRGKHWLETQFLDLTWEDYAVGLDQDEVILPIPGLGWTRVSSEGPPRPLRGQRITLKISGSAELIGADVDFLQGDALAKFLWPLWDGARLRTRAEVGLTLAEAVTQLPASVRYFAGGDTSIRGYDFRTLGPTDEFGIVTGGRHQLIGSVEIDQTVFGSWAVAAFIDGGNAFDDFDDIDPQFSVGAGIRWFSPLGPIRVDIGVPLASDAPDDYRLHISLGPDL